MNEKWLIFKKWRNCSESEKIEKLQIYSILDSICDMLLLGIIIIIYLEVV